MKTRKRRIRVPKIKIKKKRKAPKITIETAKKIVANPKTPPQLKKYWKNRFKLK